jgi:hypothetical protein
VPISSEIESEVACCFCAEPSTGASPCVVTIEVDLEDNGSQRLWAHSSCLNQLLHPSVPFLSGPA